MTNDKKHKTLLSPTLFYLLVGTMAAMIVIMTISTIISAYSETNFREYFDNLENTSEDTARASYRFLIIIRYVMNCVILVFTAVYTYFAYVKIKIGFIYATMLTFVYIGTIASVWAVGYGVDLWYQILTTIISTAGVGATCALYVLLSQLKNYRKFANRFGED